MKNDEMILQDFSATFHREIEMATSKWLFRNRNTKNDVKSTSQQAPDYENTSTVWDYYRHGFEK